MVEYTIDDIRGPTVAREMAQLKEFVLAQFNGAIADAEAAAAAAATAAATAAANAVLANTVKKTGEASQSIAGDVAVTGTLDAAAIGTASTPIVCGNLTAFGNVSLDDTTLQGNLSASDANALINLSGVGSVLVPAPTSNSEAATKKYVDDALDAYVPMLRTTGNQTKSGILTLTNQPVMALGGSGGRLPTLSDYLHFGTVQSSADVNLTIPVIIFERSGLVIGDIAVTVSDGAVTTVLFSGKTVAGTSTRIFVGAAKSANGVELYCHSDSVNRYFVTNILGAMSGNGYGQRVAPAMEIVNSTPTGYVEAAFMEA